MRRVQADHVGAGSDVPVVWLHGRGGVPEVKSAAAALSAPSVVRIVIERECRFKKRSDGKQGCRNCSRPKKSPTHMGAPPSLNVLGSGNRFLYQHFKEAWGAVFADHLRGSNLHQRCYDQVSVEGAVCFGDRVKRDQGNYRFILEKALGDTLVAEGYLEDDTWDRYSFGNLDLVYEPRRSFTELVLFAG